MDLKSLDICKGGIWGEGVMGYQSEITMVRIKDSHSLWGGGLFHFRSTKSGHSSSKLMSCHVKSYHVMPYHAISCQSGHMAWHMPCHVIYDVMFYVMSMSCQIMSYTMSYHAIFHVVVGCGVLGFTRQYREKEQGS